jgi:CRP/FNR family cyclic AMP-dependent transcriptional regulator
MIVRRFDPMVFLNNVGGGKTVTVYKPGQTIFRQHDVATDIFYLQTGRAKEIISSEQGKEAVVGMLEPGVFFGASGMYGGAERLSTVTALTTCTATAITQEAMKLALHRPQFAQLFMAYLLDHNSRIEAERINLLFNSSEKRLALKLIMLAHVADGEPEVIGPEITQEMLAEMIGTTRPRVNYFLNKFRKLGFIKYNGGIVVLPALLEAVLQGTPGIRDTEIK